MPDRGQQVSVIAQENLKLAAFLFHHRWRYTFDWDIKGVHEDRVYLLAGQKKLKNKYKELDILPKINNLIWQGQWRPSKSTSDHVKVSQGHF